MFYSIDGIDGTGKSTQLKLLCDYLRNQGKTVVLCRDPGSTALSEQIRDVILHRDDLPTCRLSQMFLFLAARAQLVNEIIAPALNAGKIVVSDRFALSSIVYQGYAGGIDPRLVEKLSLVASEGIRPDKTFVLDVPPEVASVRMGERTLDRIEREDAEFKLRLRQGFLTEAKSHPDSIILINSAESIQQVHETIIANLGQWE